MSDNLSVAEGVVEMASANGILPWHRSGFVFLPGEVPDSGQMITRAHLDWKVELRQEGFAGADGTWKEYPGRRVLVRSDIDRPLANVTPRYQPFQNDRAFAFLDSLAQDRVMRYETAGALFGGKLVWIMARLPGDDLVGKDDIQQRWLLWSMGHGGEAITARMVRVRVVCANTYRAAVGGVQPEIRFRHMGDLSKEEDKARSALVTAHECFNTIATIERKMSEYAMTKEKVDTFLASVFPRPRATATKTAEQRKRAMGAWEEIIQTAWTNYANPETSSADGTLWGVFNAVTKYADHQRTVRGKSESKVFESRFKGTLLNGEPAHMKARALEMAAALVA